MALASVLVLLLIVVIFCCAAYYVSNKAPEPIRGWILAALVVVAAIIAIVWLASGGLMGVRPGLR